MRRPPKALLIDLDGTVFFKGAPLPGAAEALDRLSAYARRFLTNSDSRLGATLQGELSSMGLQIPRKELFTAVDAALKFMDARPEARCLCLLSNELLRAFEPYLARDGEKPHYVIVGDPREWATYATLDRAFRAIVAGARIVALQRGRYFLKADGCHLDTGGFVELLEYASGTQAQLLGKPSAEFFRGALSDLGCESTEAAVIGDDLTTDIAGAKAIGATAILVQTGKFDPQSLAASPVQPDYLAASFAAVPQLLEAIGK